jgi:hypothetical protein
MVLSIVHLLSSIEEWLVADSGGASSSVDVFIPPPPTDPPPATTSPSPPPVGFVGDWPPAPPLGFVGPWHYGAGVSDCYGTRICCILCVVLWLCAYSGVDASVIGPGSRRG